MRSSSWSYLQLALLALLVGCAAPDRSGSSARPSATPGSRAPRTAPYDVEHYALDLRLEPDTRSLRGTCTVRLWPTEEGLEQVALDLVGLEVDAVHDALGRELGFVHVGQGPDGLDGTLRVQLAEPAGPGEPVELQVLYGGTPRKGLWYSSVRGGVPTQAFTQGQCQDARWWFPCFDEPHDRATSEVRVTLPPGWRSVAAGELVDQRELDDGGRVEHWRMSFPHPPYLVTLVAGDLVQTTGSWDGVPLAYLAAPEHALRIEPSLSATPRALEVLSELTGVRYPYSKYSQACVAGFPLGGMENISATTLTEEALRDERGLRDWDPTDLVVHEAAHQWFGNLLTCRDWSHVWLNEGFATYAELLYVERVEGRDAFDLGVRAMQATYLDADVGANRRPTVWNVYTDPGDLFWTGHTYDGGGSRLHLLRGVLGDEAFFAGLRAYVRENAGRGVTTDDLRRALETASGRDLGTLFRQWFAERGYPELEVRWDWDEAAREVRLSVEQVQAYADGTPVVFRLPAEVDVRTSSGTTRHRVELTARRQLLTLPAEERPRWVRFDPRAWIPKRLNEARRLAVWLDLAAEAPDAAGRAEALVVLARTASEGADAAERGAIAAVALECLQHDPVSAVRAMAARTLGRIGPRGGPPLGEALRTAAARDGAAAVRVAALEALGAWAPQADLAAFAREQFEAGYSWRTMGAAAALVRAAEPDSDAAYAWLAERLDRPSPHDELRAALLVALAATGKQRGLEILRSFALDRSAGEQARIVSVRELGRRGRHLTVVREDLVSLLDTRLYRLRLAVVEALGGIGGAPVTDALEEAYRGETEPRIRRRIEAVLRSERVRS